jgi:hypothetical protein
MASVSNSFTAVGNGTEHPLRKGDSFTYSVSGTFVGTVILEHSDNGGVAWKSALSADLTAADSGVVEVDYGGSNAGLYRFRCSAFTSGTIVCSITDYEVTLETVNDLNGDPIYRVDEDALVYVKDPQTEAGVGVVAGTGVSVVEYGDGAVHKTVFTFDSVQVDVVSVTTGNGVGGTKIYDFPAGYIQLHGAVGEVSLAVLTEADFTDGTPEGDIGIGTVAPANADALGTDATDDNFCTAAAFTMSAYADSDVNLAPEASANFDGTSTAIDLYFNALVDAADIDDDTTGELLVSGTLTVVWSLLGDY